MSTTKQKLTQFLLPWRRRSPKQVVAWVLLFWIPLVAALYPFFFRGMHLSWTQWLISVTVSTVAFTSCYGGAHLASLLESRFFLARGLSSPKRGRMFGFIVAALIMPFGTFAGLTLASWMFGFDPPALTDLGDMKGSLTIGLVFMTTFTIMHAMADLRDAKLQAEKQAAVAENERLKAQLSALTAQMNPHLLFNALNTIASLTQSDADAAEAMTVRLAELYRAVLDASQREWHSLADELRLCRAYLEIEQARFGERLRFTFELQPGLEAVMCPPLLIQPLVENAVKHGIAPLPAGGRIAVRLAKTATNVAAVVEDTGVGMAADAESKASSTALKNLRSRLLLAYKGEGKLTHVPLNEGGTVATVTFPVRSPA